MAAPMPLPLFHLPPDEQRAWLVDRLSRPRPATLHHRSDGFRGHEAPTVPKAAAVLVPLVNRPEGLQLLLTQRSSDLPHHPGQISFPGGRVEADDASHAAAALRETEEEVGLLGDKVSILGELGTYETRSGFRVTPIVGWIDPPFEVRPDPVEVADIFEVPLAHIFDRSNHLRHYRMYEQARRDFWVIPYGERYIWGATAAMLVMFRETLLA